MNSVYLLCFSGYISLINPSCFLLEKNSPLPETESQKFTWTKPEEYSSPEALLKALHRALVEVFTFLSAGQDPLNAVTSQSENPTDWTVAVRIDPSEDKSHAVLTFPNADVRDRILRARNSGIDEETERGDISKAQARVQDSAATAPVEAAENVLEESGEDEIKSAADAADADAVEAASKEAFASSETVKSENELLNENTTSVAENQLAGQTTAPPLIEGVSWGKDWKSISIKDPLIKFAVSTNATSYHFHLSLSLSFLWSTEPNHPFTDTLIILSHFFSLSLLILMKINF